MTDLSSLAGIQASLDSSPFQRFLGLRAVAFDRDEPRIALALPYRPELARGNSGERLHGGVLMALMDVAGDYALGIKLGYLIPTIDLRADFLRPSVSSVRAVATIIRCGRTIGVADVVVFDESDKQVATGRGVYSTRRPE